MTNENELKFEVTLNFSDPIPQDKHGEIRQNVLDALRSYVDLSESDLVGNVDAYTTGISVESKDTTLVCKSSWKLKGV